MSRTQRSRGVPATPADNFAEAGTSTTVPGADVPRDDVAGAGGAPGPGPTWVRLWWTPLVLFAVVGLLAAGAGLRGLLERPPGDSSVDVGFARDMSEHHAQAVQMAMVEFGRGTDDDVRGMAQDMALSQQREIGIMSSWLSGWGRSRVSTDAPMGWMTDGGGATGGEHAEHETAGAGGGETVRMPGMATESELAELAAASGRDLDVLFLTLMIRHHRGGVAMAQYASLHAEEDKVRAFARAMVVNQSAEVDQMQRYLERLGAPRA